MTVCLVVSLRSDATKEWKDKVVIYPNGPSGVEMKVFYITKDPPKVPPVPDEVPRPPVVCLKWVDRRYKARTKDITLEEMKEARKEYVSRQEELTAALTAGKPTRKARKVC